MKKFTLISSLVLLMQQGIALGCPEGRGHHGSRLEALDTNKDALLSKDEVKDQPFLLEKFDEIDTNKDAQLSKEELKAHREAHRPPHPPKEAPADSAE